MKKVNSMDRKTYWAEIVLLAVFSSIVFYFWGFRNTPFLDRKGSVIFFLILSVVMVLTLGFLSGKRHRGNISIWCTVLSPLEFYSVIVYFTSQTWRILLLVAVWILGVAAYYLLKTHKAMGKGEQFKLSGRELRGVLRTMWVIGTAVYLIFLFPILYRGAHGIEVSLDYTLVSTDKSGMTITGQMKGLSVLSEEVWKKLNDTQKESALQLVAEIECNELGISHELYIGIRDFGESEVSSCYTAADYKILIDSDAFKKMTGMELVGLVCHQAYHAFERNMVDLYMDTDRNYQGLNIFTNVKTYVAELQKNIQALDDRVEADREQLEADATAYAETKVQEYKKWVDFYIKSNE